MAICVNRYNFDIIYSQMKKEFGSIKKGEEDSHNKMLFPMESNLLKTHRSNPASDSRQLSEAISLVLFQIKSYLTGEELRILLIYGRKTRVPTVILPLRKDLWEAGFHGMKN